MGRSSAAIAAAAGMLATVAATGAQALDATLQCGGSSNITISGNDLRPREVVVEIREAGGRIHVPDEILPTHRAEKDGWWPLYDVTASETEVVGHFRLNPVNKPLVRINRLTGLIEIRGFNNYTFDGACQPVTTARLF